MLTVCHVCRAFRAFRALFVDTFVRGAAKKRRCAQKNARECGGCFYCNDPNEKETQQTSRLAEYNGVPWPRAQRTVRGERGKRKKESERKALKRKKKQQKSERLLKGTFFCRFRVVRIIIYERKPSRVHSGLCKKSPRILLPV